MILLFICMKIKHFNVEIKKMIWLFNFNYKCVDWFIYIRINTLQLLINVSVYKLE